MNHRYALFGLALRPICNWWGDETGPSGAGSGSGDGVEGNVNFSSWLTDEVWTMLHYGLYLPSVRA